MIPSDNETPKEHREVKVFLPATVPTSTAYLTTSDWGTGHLVCNFSLGSEVSVNLPWRQKRLVL